MQKPSMGSGYCQPYIIAIPISMCMSTLQTHDLVPSVWIDTTQWSQCTHSAGVAPSAASVPLNIPIHAALPYGGRYDYVKSWVQEDRTQLKEGMCVAGNAFKLWYIMLHSTVHKH